MDGPRKPAPERGTTYHVRTTPRSTSSRDPAPADASAYSALCAKFAERLKQLDASCAQLAADWREDHELLIQLASDREDQRRRISLLEKDDPLASTVELAKVAQTVDSLDHWRRTTRGLFWAAVLGLAGTVGGGIWQAARVDYTTSRTEETVKEVRHQLATYEAAVRYARELTIEKTSSNGEALKRLEQRLGAVETLTEKLADTRRRR